MRTTLKLALLPLMAVLTVSCATSNSFHSEIHVWPDSAEHKPHLAETRLALSKTQNGAGTTTVKAIFVDVHSRSPQKLSATIPGQLGQLKTDWVTADLVRLTTTSGTNLLEFRRDSRKKWSVRQP
ncbi:hypothetical protein SAMN02745181_0958 [Rubritalea squalenifaciens DSM 18772]|uniref:Uncharacterized protein n=1 Tax=Rubritalea squalenifaciens DSM 18772 TaxID=1123071 RepID=A0A1M6E7V1_9BACT|nr:hypothetical protein [Rubritalea squalenifaciens]SHI81483.1 hypothetical protein SAMN02745181_0958 [Rubritalea squalenifaciens DSM 18772]